MYALGLRVLLSVHLAPCVVPPALASNISASPWITHARSCRLDAASLLPPRGTETHGRCAHDVGASSIVLVQSDQRCATKVVLQVVTLVWVVFALGSRAAEHHGFCVVS